MAFLNSAFTRVKQITAKQLDGVKNGPIPVKIDSKKNININIKDGCVLYLTTPQIIKGTTIAGDRVVIDAPIGLLPIWFKSLDFDGFKEGTVIGLY